MGTSTSHRQAFLRRAAAVAVLFGAAQAVVLAAGWFFVYQETHENVAQGVEDVILQANTAAANSIVDAMGGLPEELVHGSAEWQRAQHVIENLALGSGGFACILDTDGFIACHPELDTLPGLRELNLGEELITVRGEDRTAPLASLGARRIITGTMEFTFDGRHYISTFQDRPGGTRLLVHQPVSGLTAAANHLTGGILFQMGLAGGLVCCLTMVLGYLISRAHSGEMARWNATLEQRVHDQTKEVLRARHGILFGIAKLSEYRDDETGAHVERMCAYAKALAIELARRGEPLDAAWIRNIEVAASLHDIGKVSIPDAILCKPGKLTAEEFSIMQTHTSAGEDALLAVRDRVGPDPLLDMGIAITSGHHERWDGSGYPHGLAGEDIPLEARIVAVADVFDALASRRVYKPAFDREHVGRLLREESGSHFDPNIIAAFEAIEDELWAIRARHRDVEETPSLVPHVEARQQEPWAA